MADIKLGQSIVGALTSSDPKLAGSAYDEYNISGLDAFRKVKISLDRPSMAGETTVQVIHSTTGEVLNGAVSATGTLSLNGTSFPNTNYKIRVTGKNLGNYTLSLSDDGKATSIVSLLNTPTTTGTKVRLGTVEADGTFLQLASSADNFGSNLLSDIALSPTGKLYGIGNSADGKDSLYQLDPSADIRNRIKLVDDVKDDQGVLLKNTFNALEFSADNQLYAIGSGSNKLYQINPNTSVATSIADLPTGFTSSGDLVFDAANNRLLATSKDTTTSDALWQISIANPSGATKIGQIGFAGVQGINFENGQLTGFTNTGIGIKSVTNRIKINPTSGVGTFDRVITGTGILAGVSGSATIPSSSLGLDTKPDPLNSIGSKSQGLPQRNTIDLRDFAGKALKADITTKGDAAYTNNIGFYVVEDVLLGTIKLANGSLLNPGDASYAVEAAKSAVLQAGKIDSKLDQDITGGKIYAPIVIAQGSLTDFVTKNPTNGGGAKEIHAYFNYVSGNADKVDHFKLLGNNIFAVEDQFGGGDRDFNDLVVSINIKTV
jgi:Domain of unknown function (DUF4114)